MTTRRSQRATCPHCEQAFDYERYHAGFSNLGHLYCDRDETVLTWDSYGATYRRLADEKHPWMLNPAEQLRVEDALMPCSTDGGRFAFANPPLCRNCHQSIEFLVPHREYLVVTGTQLDADVSGMWRLPA